MGRKEEVKVKLERVRRFLRENNLSAMLIKKQPNFSWITAGGVNFVGMTTETGVTSVLVTEKEAFVIANRIESKRMREEEVGEIGFEVLEYEWYEDKEMEIVKKITGNRNIGCDIPLSETQFVEGTFKKLRYELTEEEIERYKYLGEKLSKIVEEVLMYEVKPGQTEIEVAGEISAKLWKEGIEPTAFMISSDDRVRNYRHPISKNKRIEKLLMASVNARYKGLYTTITRMAYFGEPPAALKKQYQDNVEIECIMIAKTRIGEEMRVPVLSAIEEYEKRGYKDEWKLHHQGGAMGYYPREIRVTPSTAEKILKNQAFCWNPSISGTKSEDGFIVTEKGPIMITKPVIFPKLSIEVEGITLIKPDMLIIT
ncbi:MAG: M24 family metallopeptidase [Synergistetes bacterium]|nr:M24 family metallopeptidase [Synergistota bacterium]MCX8128322.1 M24 family metallopeptidase [Synergistota bacterium]MDW8192641.1 M24 family metallopeptidase [Synergistota bacterium]